MNEEEEGLFLVAVLQMCYLAYKLLKQKKRSWWVRPLCSERSSKGFLETTFMKNYDPDLLFKSTRMSKMQYELLLNLVEKSLRKTSIRKSVSPEFRIVLTLMYLSQGVSPHYLASSFKLGVSTVRQIIVEVCQILWELLSPVYMAELNSCDLTNISKEFNDRWNMPHCVGSVGGKHIKIKRPPNSGSKYINYKGYCSIVLLGICDANYTFTAVDVGAYGSQSDAGIFRNSSVGKKIFESDVNLPRAEKLPNSERVVPYYFVGDSAFPLRHNLMRPYPGIVLNKPEDVFNYRLSRAHRTIENTFGILAARWRILGKSIDFHPKNADKIVLACVILHNFLKTTDTVNNCNSYCPENYCDSYGTNGERFDGMWRLETHDLLPIRRCGTNNRANEASDVRKTLTDYFLNEGKASFQPQ